MPPATTEKEALEAEITHLKDGIASRRAKLTSIYSSLASSERSKERCIFLKSECFKTLIEIQTAPIVKIKVWKETKELYDKNIILIIKYSNDLASKRHNAERLEQEIDHALAMVRTLQRQNEQIGVILPFKKVIK